MGVFTFNIPPQIGHLLVTKDSEFLVKNVFHMARLEPPASNDANFAVVEQVLFVVPTELSPAEGRETRLPCSG